MEGKNVVEEDKVEFKLECEEDDADVKWFKDGVEIIPDGKRYLTRDFIEKRAKLNIVISFKR